MHNTDVLRVKAAYVQAPFQVTYREIVLDPPASGEALLDVLATGICGHDMEIASLLAKEPTPFGHEICARVRAVGPGVTHLKAGDQVVLESSSFCGLCADCRNGRADLCRNLVSFWGRPAMGFSPAMLSPARCAVPAEGLDPAVASLAEPCGVALDMVKLSEVGMGDRVLVVGAGAIGLMAAAIVRRRTCGKVVVVDSNPGRLTLARGLGADEVFSRHEVTLGELGKKFGGFHKVLVTAPPGVLNAALEAAVYGGIVVFIGFDWGEGGKVAIDTTAMHVGKKQLRASFASPAMYLPEAVELLRTGVVPGGKIVTHRMPLSRLAEALQKVRTDRQHTCKVAILPDELYRA